LGLSTPIALYASLGNASGGSLEPSRNALKGDQFSDEVFDYEGPHELRANPDGTVELYNKDTLTKVPVQSAEYSQDNRFSMTVGMDNRIRIWDLKTKTIMAVKEADGPNDNVKSAVFTRDHNYVVTFEPNKEVKVWDTQTGDLLATFGSKK
jgi:WD40 repeat protein